MSATCAGILLSVSLVEEDHVAGEESQMNGCGRDAGVPAREGTNSDFGCALDKVKEKELIRCVVCQVR
jgi:hypothetical protein